MVTLSDNLSKESKGYTWRAACGVRRARGAGKAVRVGFWGSLVCAEVTKYAGLRAALWLVRNSRIKNMEIRLVGSVGEVATVGLGMTGEVGPGGGEKTSRLMVSCLVLPRPIEFPY